MADNRGNSNSARPQTYWRANGSHWTLFVEGQKRAEAHTLINHGEIHEDRSVSGRATFKDVVLPLGQSVVDEIEKRLSLKSRPPVLDEHDRPLPDKRRELDDNIAYYRDKKYLNTDNPRDAVTAALTEARAALNDAERDRSLTPGATEARAKCAEALRVLSDRSTPSGSEIPNHVAEAVKSAADSVRRDDPPAGKSFVETQSHHVYAARHHVLRALEHVEKQEKVRARTTGGREGSGISKTTAGSRVQRRLERRAKEAERTNRPDDRDMGR